MRRCIRCGRPSNLIVCGRCYGQVWGRPAPDPVGSVMAGLERLRDQEIQMASDCRDLVAQAIMRAKAVAYQVAIDMLREIHQPPDPEIPDSDRVEAGEAPQPEPADTL